MKLIACVDSNWGIGKDDQLLFHIKEDMNFFKTNTLGKIVIMGRKTFESLPNKQPLKWRINVVLTHDQNFKHDGIMVYHNIQSLLNDIPEVCIDDVVVIGGEEIYKQFLPYCDEALITKVDAMTDANKFMHNLSKDGDWVCTKSSIPLIDTDNGVMYHFYTYKRY